MYWIGVNLDIEDRKQAEFYLAEGQRFGHTGSWAFDPAGFDYWSPELFRMHGLDRACKPPTVQEYLDRIHPQDRESMANLIEELSAKASPLDATKRVVRPNGEVRYLRYVGAPVAENQSLKRYVGSAIDVTEHELLTQELRRREAYLAEAQRLSHTGSFGWDVSSGEIYWSDETFRIFELDPKTEITIELIVQRTHPDDRLAVQQVIERASTERKEFALEHRLLMPDGSIKYVHVVGHPSTDKGCASEFVGAVTDITDQRRAEESLRKSEGFLAEAEKLSHTGSCAWNVVTGEQTWSEENYRILGYDRSIKPTLELIRDRVHPDDRQVWQQTIARAGEGKEVDFESRLLMPDGSVKHVHVVADGVKKDGKLVEVIGTARDITERKRAEEVIRRSEAYLADAQKLSHTGSWAWSPDKDISYWSEECYRVLGFDPLDGLPRFEEFFQRVHPDDQVQYQEVTRRAIRERLDVETEYRIVHPSGAVRDIHSIGHPVFSPSGDLIEFRGTVIDVTERKAAEEQIREQEMELRQMLDLAPQQVAVFAPGGERLYANRVALDYLGVSLEEWRKKSVRGEFFHPDDRERAARAYSDSTRSGGTAYELELRVQGADGSYRWFLARFNPLRDEQGQIKRWYAAVADIEDRKRAEEKLQLENAALREEIDQTSMFEEIVGTSPALQTVLSRISKVAPSDSTVLITGETGTGKELVARAIHRRSQRSGRAFVSVNCAAIPRDLIASELFGHEKGAFTGAIQRRLGRFELAEGGTIFLDEIGELPAETQIALLRVLQEREFERVGGTKVIRADVRVIAATNRDLQASIDAGTFRNDLYYRLNVFPIEVPPLRKRKEDIPLLVAYFIDRYGSTVGKKIRGTDGATLDRLLAYTWPGNVRELQNVIERSIILCETDKFTVDESWLPRRLDETDQVSRALFKIPASEEKKTIEAALAEAQGRVSGPSGAAAKLGIPPSTLDSKIKALKINKHRFKTV